MNYIKLIITIIGVFVIGFTTTTATTNAITIKPLNDVIAVL